LELGAGGGRVYLGQIQNQMVFVCRITATKRKPPARGEMESVKDSRIETGSFLLFAKEGIFPLSSFSI